MTGLFAYLIEFVATLFFVYVYLATGNPLAIGATLALAVLLTRSLSGGYLNPAVTIAMSSAGQLASADVIPYCLAEIFGALVALELHKRMTASKVAEGSS
jgi:glycerol uptake facilitator-like aquaporin